MTQENHGSTHQLLNQINQQPNQQTTAKVDSLVLEKNTFCTSIDENKTIKVKHSMPIEKQLFPHLRERNPSESQGLNQEWTVQQEDLLLHLHNLKGNKWVDIARQLKRNDNSVKNHYHSKLRKTLRKLNKCISDHLGSTLKPLKNNAISKIVQTAEGMYPHHSEYPSQKAKTAYNLKNRILALSNIIEQQVNEQELNEIKDLASQIQLFLKSLWCKEKPQGVSRPSSNKYKGKEIISLLTENIKITDNQILPRATSKNIRRPTSYAESDQQSSVKLQSRRQEKKREAPLPPQQDMVGASFTLFGNCPALFFFNENVYPMQQLIYPIYQQETSPIFSGRMSSFSSYLPNGKDQLQQTMTQWNTMSRIETESYRIETSLQHNLQWNESTRKNTSLP